MTGSKKERIVMLALYLSSNGLLCKIGNPYINISASTFLYILAKSISYIAKNTNNSVPFISIFPDKKSNKFSDKEHLQCQLIVVITIRIIIYVIFKFAEKVKSIRKFLKYKKLKKSSPKIEIIPLSLKI